MVSLTPLCAAARDVALLISRFKKTLIIVLVNSLNIFIECIVRKHGACVRCATAFRPQLAGSSGDEQRGAGSALGREWLRRVGAGFMSS